MISIFPLSTFHLYVATFQQHLQMEYISLSWYDIPDVLLVVSTSRSFRYSWLISGCVTRLTQRVPLVEQELLTLPEHRSSLPVLCGVRVTRSLVLYVCFVDCYLFFCPFSIYGFWLPLLVSSNSSSCWWWQFV
jgi:hypothetical protein